MLRVHLLGLPASSKASIAKSLYSVGLYGAEVGGVSNSQMNDVRTSACSKVASLRRWSPLELMAYGGTAGDPQVTADLNTISIWQRRLDAGRLDWPLHNQVWVTALERGRGRGPIRHLRLLGWIPMHGAWQCEDQYFAWYEADQRVKWVLSGTRLEIF
eukprot:2389312-Amphidinium_carterae.2